MMKLLPAAALTAAFLPAAAGAAPAPPAPSRPPDLERIRRETRAHLDALIRLDTSNPPGNEILAARYLRDALAKEGVGARILTSKPTRSSLVARLAGSGEARPLILMCHTDVVPADPKEWSTPPFDPVERDGYLYGRGSADVKSMCAAEAAILAELKRAGTRLKRDLVFFAEADEETGESERHIQWLLAEHGELLDGEFAINEGGQTVWRAGRPAEVRIQVAEKEYLDVRLLARGRAGHSSVPTSDNPVAALSRAVARVSQHRFPARLEPAAARFLRTQLHAAGRTPEPAIADVLSALDQDSLDEAADRLAERRPDFAAMLRDTVTPTVLKAGYKSNVIPETAEAVLNARLLPGRDPAEFLEELRAAIDDEGVEVSAAAPVRPPVRAMPTDTALFRAAEASARERAPDALVSPFLAAWTTDSGELRNRGVLTYGIDPPLGEDDDLRVHGVDERIPLDALDWYAGFLLDIVLRVAGDGPPASPAGPAR